MNLGWHPSRPYWLYLNGNSNGIIWAYQRTIHCYDIITVLNPIHSRWVKKLHSWDVSHSRLPGAETWWICENPLRVVNMGEFHGFSPYVHHMFTKCSPLFTIFSPCSPYFHNCSPFFTIFSHLFTIFHHIFTIFHHMFTICSPKWWGFHHMTMADLEDQLVFRIYGSLPHWYQPSDDS